jgi:hypothetical protein
MISPSFFILLILIPVKGIMDGWRWESIPVPYLGTGSLAVFRRVHEDFSPAPGASDTSKQIIAHLPGGIARQFRERWIGYRLPSIRGKPWTDSEDRKLLDGIPLVISE